MSAVRRDPELSRTEVLASVYAPVEPGDVGEAGSVRGGVGVGPGPGDGAGVGLRVGGAVVGFRRWFVVGGLVVVALASAGGLAAVAMVREPPLWWRSVDAGDPKTLSVAMAVENGVARELTLVRPPLEDGASEPWAVRLYAADANAWLNAALPKWMASQADPIVWPEALEELQVHFERGRILVGARLAEGPGGGSVLSATVNPVLREDGSLWLVPETVFVGRLPVPARWLLGGAEAEASRTLPTELKSIPRAGEVLEVVAGREPVARDAAISLGDGRQVRLLSLQADGGALLITCRTEPRGSGEVARLE